MSTFIQNWLIFILSTWQINFVQSLNNNEIEQYHEKFKFLEQMKMPTEKINIERNIPSLSDHKYKAKDLQDYKTKNTRVKRDINIYAKQLLTNKQFSIKNDMFINKTRFPLTNLQKFSRKVKKVKFLGVTQKNINEVNNLVKLSPKIFNHDNYFQEKTKTVVMEEFNKHDKSKTDLIEEKMKEKKAILIYPVNCSSISVPTKKEQMELFVNKPFFNDQYKYNINNSYRNFKYLVKNTESEENNSDKNTKKKRRRRSTSKENGLGKNISEIEKDFIKKEAFSDTNAHHTYLENHSNKNKLNVNNSTKNSFTGNFSFSKQNDSNIGTHLNLYSLGKNNKSKILLEETTIDMNDSSIKLFLKETISQPISLNMNIDEFEKKITEEDNTEHTNFNHGLYKNENNKRITIENISKDSTSTIHSAALKPNSLISILTETKNKNSTEADDYKTIPETKTEISTEIDDYQNLTETKTEISTEIEDYKNVNATVKDKNIDIQTDENLKNIKSLQKDLQDNSSQSYGDMENDTLHRNYTDNLNEDKIDEVTETIKLIRESDQDYIENVKPSVVWQSTSSAVNNFKLSIAREDNGNIMKNLSKISDVFEKSLNASTTSENIDVNQYDTVSLEFKNLWTEGYNKEAQFSENRKIYIDDTVSGNQSKKLTQYERSSNETNVFSDNKNNLVNKISNIEPVSTYRDEIFEERNFEPSFSSQTTPIVLIKADSNEVLTELSLENMSTSTDSILNNKENVSIINIEIGDNVTNINTDNYENNATRMPRNENYGAKYWKHGGNFPLKPTTTNTMLYSSYTTPTVFYKNSDPDNDFDTKNPHYSQNSITQHVVVKNCIDNILIYNSIVRYYRSRYNLTSLDINCTLILALSIPKEKTSADVINAIEKNILNRHAESIKILESNIIDNKNDVDYNDLTDRERILMYSVYALSVVVGILLLAMGFHCIYIYKKLKKSSDFYPGIEMNDYKFTQIPRPTITFPTRSLSMDRI